MSIAENGGDMMANDYLGWFLLIDVSILVNMFQGWKAFSGCL